ncbi:hypothetical protein [Chishuiella sp.]|uniref:Spy/CpxP family protein refolding chaperone n=1 Tax=Chishuiella sp. TaxID=1969467 RepID=UPI0028B12343|nr:hypothetical protein [Chishuiella sp.]
MNKKYYRFIFLFASIFVSVNASAQDKNDEASREQKLQKLKTDLNLSDAQVLKIKQIEDSFKEEKLELKRKMSEIRKKEFYAIDSVFTPEQKAKLKELHAKKNHGKKRAE